MFSKRSVVIIIIKCIITALYVGGGLYLIAVFEDNPIWNAILGMILYIIVELVTLVWILSGIFRKGPW